MLVKFNFLSQALMEQTNVTMILPSWTLFDSGKGKAESYVPGTKFQVLYLLHGGTGDDSDYIHFSNILRYAEEHKIAVVMPSGHNSSYENEPEHVQPWPHRYWDFVFDELPRVCATMFPISTKREDTFVTHKGKPMNRSNIWAAMKRLCALAGVAAQKVFPHNLRHLFARTFYKQHKDIVRLADVLGHSSVDTTRIYTLTSGIEQLGQLARMRLLI